MRSPAADVASDRGPTLAEFFRGRNEGGPVVLDRYTTNNVAFLLAYLFGRAGVSPNQITVASGGFSVAAFVASLVLPTAPLVPSVLAIFVLAQTAYVLDCADGQLARATNRASEFGAFLDKGLDALGGIFAFGAFFTYLYRHFAATGQPDTAVLVLACGFMFLAARTARLNVAQSFLATFGARDRELRPDRRPLEDTLISLMDIQASLFAMLLATVSIRAALLAFGAQSALQMLAYVRYFVRARRAAGG